MCHLPICIGQVAERWTKSEMCSGFTNSFSNIYPMNTLNISIPYSYAMDAANLNWCDVLFSINHGFLSYDAAIEHAEYELGKYNPASENILNLAMLSIEKTFPHSIHPYIDELAAELPDSERRKAKEKIMYVLLKWVYDHRSNYADPLGVVEYIYDDFNFPESISDFVRRLPMRGENLGSIERNTDRLFNRWERFLDEQKKIWGNAVSRTSEKKSKS